MEVADAAVSRADHKRFMSAASSTSRADGVPDNSGASAAARCANSIATALSNAPNSTISEALPSDKSTMSASAMQRSRKPSTMPVSSSHIAIGDRGRSCGTQSAASKMVGNPNTTSRRCTGLMTSVVFARSTETPVPSEPTSTRDVEIVRRPQLVGALARDAALEFGKAFADGVAVSLHGTEQTRDNFRASAARREVLAQRGGVVELIADHARPHLSHEARLIGFPRWS